MTVTMRRAAQLRAEGYTTGELRRMRRSGMLTAVRRGIYAAGPPPDDAAAAHALLVRATVAGLGGDAVVSHVSAAVLHGLPIWGLPMDRVTVTRPRHRSGARRTERLHVHCAPLDTDEIVVVGGIACTAVGRTVVDVARDATFASATVLADAALRAGLGAPALDDAVGRARGRPGVPRARRVATFADGRSESVGESRSRVAIARAGLPAPVLQWPIRIGDTTAYADFAWVEQRTIGEFDGRVKYGRLLRPGQDPGEVVYAEKLREDAIRDDDWEVARWTWPDVDDFGPTAARIESRFRGPR